MDPVLTVVAVSYRGSADVAGLLSSLAGQTDAAWRAVVVDNSCDPGEATRLRRLAEGDERVELMVAGANDGYFGGARLAWDRAWAHRPAWVCVCNVDVRFEPGVVAAVRELRSDAVVAPSIRSEVTGREQNPYLRSRPSRRTAFRWYWQARFVPFSRLVAAGHHASRRLQAWGGQGSTPPAGEVYAPHGSCLFLPRAWAERGGTLAHEPFLFGEEITVAERARELGLTVRYEPAVRVVHAEHRSTGVWRSRTVLESQREAAAYVRRVLA